MALSTEDFVSKAIDSGLSGDALREATAEYIRSQGGKKQQAPGFLSEQADVFKRGWEATKHYIQNPSELARDKGEIAGAMMAQNYRNVGKELSTGGKVLEKTGEVAEKTFPIISGLVGRMGATITNPGNREYQRQVGATWSGAGELLGSQVRETTQNLAGIQDDTPLGMAVKPVTSGAINAATSYVVDHALEQIGKATKPIWDGVKDKISKSGPVKWVSEKFRKQSADNMFSAMKTSKTLRKEAQERGIDLTDALFQTNKNGELIYGTDIVRNSEIAERQIAVAAAKLDKVLPNTTLDANKIINETVNEVMKTARTDADRALIQSWETFMRDRLVDNYSDVVIPNSAALAEKIIAGQSGFTASGLVEDQIRNQLEATYAMNLKNGILNNVSGAERILINNLFREEEQAILMNKIFKEGIIGELPQALRRKIGALFFPTSFIAKTIGAGVELSTDSLTRSLMSGGPTEQVATDSLGNWLRMLGLQAPGQMAANEATKLVDKQY